MKKKLLTVAALALLALPTTNAQERAGEIVIQGESHLPHFIPREFSYNHTAKFIDNSVVSSEWKQPSITFDIYGGDFELEKQMTIPGVQFSYKEYDFETEQYYTVYHYAYVGLYYYNLDDIGVWFDNYSRGDIYITQTLFNSDSKYEYIAPQVKNATDPDADHDIIGLDIMSEDGTKLYSIAEEGFIIYDYMLIKWNGDYYLKLDVAKKIEDSYSDRKHVFYRLNKATQSISRVETELPVSAFPSVASREQTITVELGEGTQATEVQVVNAVGQVVKRISVQPGQHEVQLRASDLGSGMHLVGARSRNAQGTCKIVVK